MLTALRRRLASSKGFTLVELLIVIAIIGVLAVALLAAINPVEQLRKSRDSSRLADAREYAGALQRFYTSKGCYPHDYAAPPANSCPTAPNHEPAALLSSTQGATDITQMINENELKETFRARSNLGVIHAGIDANQNPIVCFQPESDANRSLPGTQRYTLTAGNTSTAPSIAAAGTTDCPSTYTGATLATACMLCVQ